MDPLLLFGGGGNCVCQRVRGLVSHLNFPGLCPVGGWSGPTPPVPL